MHFPFLNSLLLNKKNVLLTFIFCAAVLIGIVSCNNKKDEEAKEESPAVDSTQTAASIETEDSTMIFTNPVDLNNQTVANVRSKWNRLKLKESFARSPLALITSVGYSKEDELFWKQLTATILDNLPDTELDVEKIAQMMHMSKATLYRKMKATSGMSPSDVIRSPRNGGT